MWNLRAELTETKQNWLQRARRNGEMLVKRYKLSVIKQFKSGSLMHNIVILVNNAVLAA